MAHAAEANLQLLHAVGVITRTCNSSSLNMLLSCFCDWR